MTLQSVQEVLHILNAGNYSRIPVPVITYSGKIISSSPQQQTTPSRRMTAPPATSSQDIRIPSSSGSSEYQGTIILLSNSHLNMIKPII